MHGRYRIRTLHLFPELKEGGLERGVIEEAIRLEKHGIRATVAGGIWLDRRMHATIVIYKELPPDLSWP